MRGEPISARRISPHDPPAAGTFVPLPTQAVIAIWPEQGRPHLVRLSADDQLIIGRRSGEEKPGYREGPGTWRIALPAHKPYLSRRHLRVAAGATGWRASILQDVPNPGRVRHWGDLHWRRLEAGDHVEPRDGLLALRLPGEPRFRVTVTALHPVARPRVGEQAGVRTAEETPDAEMLVSTAQLGALIDALTDAVCWPPGVDDGRVRNWSELPGSDGSRRNYNRLAEYADADAGFRWTERGVRGADPTLLRELVASGSMTYGDVYRQIGRWPDGPLIPTHHTHDASGRRTTR